MPRPRLHDDALRARLLEVASAAVSERGPAGLTVREAAGAAGTSASAVYALFGSREALVAAVAEEGFRRLAAHLEAVVPTDDPAADLLALGLAYRASALADPHFYRVMFARTDTSSPGVEHRTFGVLRDAVARVLADGAPADVPRGGQDAATRAALGLWAHVHGLVGLELAGLLPGSAATAAARYERSLRTVGPALLADAAAP